MKSNKGITLINLIIYIAVLVLVLGILSSVSSMFFTNVDYIKETSEYVAEYNKFNACFIEDVKNNKNVYQVSKNQVIFEDGTTYSYVGEGEYAIYRNKVKICENIMYCRFSDSKKYVNNTEKHIIHVKMYLKSSKVFETENDYVLRYW